MKKMIKKVIAPVLVITVLFAVLRPFCIQDGKCNYFLLLLLMGIPFGIGKMCVWMVPRDFDLGGTLAVWTMNFLIGGLIGSVVLLAMIGKHFMDIMNGSYAQTHFPCKLWDAGEKGLTLSAFEWEKDRKTLIYGQVDYMYGEALYKPEMKEGNPIRLYSLDEIAEIFCKLGLRICNSFADFSGKPSSDNDIQLMVYSIRE